MGIHGEDLAPDFDSDYDGSDSDSGGSGGEGAAGRKRGRRKRRKKRAAGTGGTGDTGEEEDASESGERNFTEYSIQFNSIQAYELLTSLSRNMTFFTVTWAHLFHPFNSHCGVTFLYKSYFRIFGGSSFGGI